MIVTDELGSRRPVRVHGLIDSFDQLIVGYEGLQRRLATSPVIERAKIILIGRLGIDADAVFAVLRWGSR